MLSKHSTIYVYLLIAGYETMKGVENYDGVNENDGELSLSMNILKNQIGFSPSSSHNDRRQGGSNGDGRYYEFYDTNSNKFPYDSDGQVFKMLNY